LPVLFDRDLGREKYPPENVEIGITWGRGMGDSPTGQRREVNNRTEQKRYRECRNGAGEPGRRRIIPAEELSPFPDKSSGR
jgi:hypothetical protein